MKILIALLWIGVSLSYLRYRAARRLEKSDILISVAFAVFGISAYFEGEVFWLPTWNVWLKVFGFVLLFVSFLIDRNDDGNEIQQ